MGKTTTAKAQGKAKGEKRAKAPARRKKAEAPETREDAHELKAALARAAGHAAPPERGRPPARKLSAKERQSLRGLVVYLDEDARKQLARLAIDQGRTTQDLGVEAVNLLFQFYGVAGIA